MAREQLCGPQFPALQQSYPVCSAGAGQRLHPRFAESRSSFQIVVSAIAPFRLRPVKTDEHGQAVHEECYVLKVLLNDGGSQRQQHLYIESSKQARDLATLRSRDAGRLGIAERPGSQTSRATILTPLAQRTSLAEAARGTWTWQPLLPSLS